MIGEVVYVLVRSVIVNLAPFLWITAMGGLDLARVIGYWIRYLSLTILIQKPDDID